MEPNPVAYWTVTHSVNTHTRSDGRENLETYFNLHFVTQCCPHAPNQTNFSLSKYQRHYPHMRLRLAP